MPRVEEGEMRKDPDAFPVIIWWVRLLAKDEQIMGLRYLIRPQLIFSCWCMVSQKSSELGLSKPHWALEVRQDYVALHPE